MIPYFFSETYQILGIPLQTWGTFVAAGYAIGTTVAWRRAKQKGLKADLILDLAFWMLIAAFVGARAFHVLFYDLAHYLAHPIDVFNPRLPGYAMFGGFLGAATVFAYFVWTNKLKVLSYADALIWGLPWGIGIGRIGCFLIHDHPGIATALFLGVRYPDGVIRHDLGLYLSLIGFATGLLFLALNRYPRRAGFFLAVFMMIEGATRIGLDFLRVADARFLGLTPTQYFSIPLFVVGAWLLRRSLTRA